MMILASIIIATLVGLATDYVWARWSANVALGNPFVAANWAFLTHVAALVFTLAVIDGNWIAILAYFAGSYVGAYLAVSGSSRRMMR